VQLSVNINHGRLEVRNKEDPTTHSRLVTYFVDDSPITSCRAFVRGDRALLVCGEQDGSVLFFLVD
jgi:hypothetical protein